jgi:hypothetical protein
MNATHVEQIDTAFLQLSFAMKLMQFLDDHPIDKDDFDISLTFEDAGNRVCLSHNEFETYEHLQLAAENNFLICFGAAAITLWEAIREHGGLESKNLNPENSRKEKLAAFSYMVRCCFAHGMARPVWSIHDDKYRTVYQIGNKNIDLSKIAEDQPFDYASIGGFETLWFLKDEARAEDLLKPVGGEDAGSVPASDFSGSRT